MFCLINIGCIECGVSSGVVGVFSSREDAEKLQAKCTEKLSWRESGQNAFEIFEIPSGEFVSGTYQEALSE